MWKMKELEILFFVGFKYFYIIEFDVFFYFSY